MKYYAVKVKFGRKDKKAGKHKELEARITALDRAILNHAESRRGDDMIGLVGACHPYVNKWGGKEFASSPVVRGAVIKLLKLGLLERR